MKWIAPLARASRPRSESRLTIVLCLAGACLIGPLGDHLASAARYQLPNGEIVVLPNPNSEGSLESLYDSTSPIVDGWQPGWCAAGSSGTYTAAVAWRDQLVVAGSFGAIGAVRLRNVGLWSGSEWEPLGDGLPGPVQSLAVYEGQLLALTLRADQHDDRLTQLFAWNDATWEPFTTAAIRGAWFLLTTPNDVYLLGDRFEIAIPDSVMRPLNVAAWDGEVWTPIRPPFGERAGYHPAIFEAVSSGDGISLMWDLVEDHPDPDGLHSVDPKLMSCEEGRWRRRGSWCPSFGGIIGLIGEIDGRLSVSGYDYPAGCSVVTFRRGESNDCDADVANCGDLLEPSCVAIWQGRQYFGFHAARTGEERVASLHDGVWQPTHGGPKGRVRQLVATTNRMFALGSFHMAGAEQTQDIAQWDGDTWTAVGGPCGDGIRGTISGVLSDGNGFLASGEFWSAGDLTVNGLARWHGAEWTRPEVPAVPYGPTAGSLARVGSDVFAVLVNSATGIRGVYRVGGESATEFAQLDGPPASLSVHRGALVLTGDFRWVGQSYAPKLAIWSPQNGWRNPEPRLLGRVHDAISTPRGLLVLGNEIQPHDGSILRASALLWNDGVWSGVESAPEFMIQDHIEYGNKLIVVGKKWVQDGVRDHTPFGHYKGVIASWAGGEWKSLADSINAPVRALQIYNEELVVGGQFTFIDGASLNHLARFHNGAWESVGGGVDGPVSDLASTSLGLVVAGQFGFAGGVNSANIAVYNETPFAATEAIAVTDSTEIVLSWRAPDNSEYVGALVRFGRDSYPVNTSDGESIEGYEGLIPGEPGTLQFIRHDVPANSGIYRYAIFGRNASGNFARAVYAEASAPVTEFVARFELHATTPNPCRRGFAVSYSNDRRRHAHLELFDVTGRGVRVVFDGLLEVGPGRVVWDGLDSEHRPVPSGAYFLRFDSESKIRTQRVLVIR